jgi:predicted nucleotidyltransferase
MAPNTMKLSDELETRIRDALAPLHPEAVILFGSYAWGQLAEGSDIDLYTHAPEICRNRQQLRPPDHERRVRLL